MPVYAQKKITGKTFIPGAIQLSNGQKAKGLFILSGEAITLASGGIFWYLSNKEYDKYMELSSGTPQEEFDKHFYNSENYGTIAICSFAATGAVYLYSIIDAIWISKPNEKQQDKKTSFYFLPKKDGLNFCLLINF